MNALPLPLQLCYVSYEDLVQRPTEVLRKIYTDLKLGGFEEIEPLLVKEEEAAKAFTKNTHKVGVGLLHQPLQRAAAGGGGHLAGRHTEPSGADGQPHAHASLSSAPLHHSVDRLIPPSHAVMAYYHLLTGPLLLPPTLLALSSSLLPY